MTTNAKMGLDDIKLTEEKIERGPPEETLCLETHYLFWLNSNSKRTVITIPVTIFSRSKALTAMVNMRSKTSLKSLCMK